MKEKNITVRVERSSLENAKRYAAAQNTTLSNIIRDYLNRLPYQPPFEKAPIVRHLTGLLSSHDSRNDYKSYLEEKYRH
jgi:hypothetical protein